LIRIGFLIKIVIAIEMVKSRFDEKISLKVCLKIFNQGAVAKG